MTMRPATFALSFCAAGLIGLAGVFVDAHFARQAAQSARPETLALVARLGLTDPVIFTEARYTRHLSQADMHSAFQDHPLALEHFPSGSLVPPPPGLLARYAHLDREAASSD